MSQKPPQHFDRRKFLYPPVYLDVHPISTTHHHIGLVYFAKAATDHVTLAADEHEAIRWFSEAELHDPAFGIQPDVLFYACAPRAASPRPCFEVNISAARDGAMHVHDPRTVS